MADPQPHSSVVCCSDTPKWGLPFISAILLIPPDAIAEAVGKTDSQEERQRKLPSQLVVSLVIAMSLWSSDSMQTVLKKLVNGLSTQWIRLGQYWRVPSSSSSSEARQRVGCQVMSQLFYQVVRPLATRQTPGAFLGGLRMMAVDGTVFDVPDTEENARVFGYPGSRPGTRAAFPKVRLVLLIEAGTHLIVDTMIVSLPHGRTSPGQETAALSHHRDVADVGPRTAFRLHW